MSDGSGKVATNAVTSTELGYLSGVTSAIQTQLNAKADLNTAYSFLTGTIGGANSGVSASTTTYIGLTGQTISAVENARVTVFPQNCTLSRLYFVTSTAQPATGTLVVTLRKNNADTAMVITIAAGSAANFFSNTTTSISFTPGQYACLKLTNNATTTSANINCTAIMVTI